MGFWGPSDTHIIKVEVLDDKDFEEFQKWWRIQRDRLGYNIKISGSFKVMFILDQRSDLDNYDKALVNLDNWGSLKYWLVK